MKIIIEGTDGSGKTTLVEALSDKYHCDVVHMAKNGWKDPQSYTQKMLLDNVILDRSYISEVVYSAHYKRDSKITEPISRGLTEAYNMLGWKTVLLTCDPEEAVKRIDTRGIDKEDTEKIKSLYSLYYAFATSNNIPIVDTTNLTPEEVEKKVSEILEANNG